MTIGTAIDTTDPPVVPLQMYIMIHAHLPAVGTKEETLVEISHGPLVEVAPPQLKLKDLRRTEETLGEISQGPLVEISLKVTAVMLTLKRKREGLL